MPRLDHVALPVADLQASKAWLVDVLGLRVEIEAASSCTSHA